MGDHHDAFLIKTIDVESRLNRFKPLPFPFGIQLHALKRGDFGGGQHQRTGNECAEPGTPHEIREWRAKFLNDWKKCRLTRPGRVF